MTSHPTLNHPSCLFLLLLCLLCSAHASFSRSDWVQEAFITAFTTCGLDVGPVYVETTSKFSVASTARLKLWTYDSYELVNQTVKFLACQQYGEKQLDTLVAAILYNNSDNYINSVGVFQIRHQSRAISRLDINYTINQQKIMPTQISLEEGTLAIQYLNASQSNRTTFIRVYQVGHSPNPVKSLVYSQSNITMKLDNEANLGVYNPTNFTFTLYHGDTYEYSYSVTVDVFRICQYSSYGFAKLKYERADYPRDQNGNYAGDMAAAYYIQSRFYLVYQYSSSDNYQPCNIVIDVLKFPTEPKRKELSEAYNMGVQCNYMCDGRNFFSSRATNAIDESENPIFYSDIVMNQPIEQVLCSKRPSKFFFLSDYVVFYILSVNQSSPQAYFHTFIDVYEETSVFRWILVGIASFCILVCVLGVILQYGICKVLGVICFDLSHSHLMQINDELEK